MWSTPRILSVAFAIFCAATAIFSSGSFIDVNSAYIRLNVFAFTGTVSFLFACMPVATREYLVGRWLRAATWVIAGVGLAGFGLRAAVASAVAVGNEDVVLVGIPRGVLVLFTAISLVWAYSRQPASWPKSGNNVSAPQWYRLLRRILTGYYGWPRHAANDAVSIIRDRVEESSRRTPSKLGSQTSTSPHPADLYGEAWQVAAEFAAHSSRSATVSPRLVFLIASGFILVSGGLFTQKQFAAAGALVVFAIVLSVFGAILRRTR